MDKIITIDLNFLGVPGTIAAYLIPHHDGVILIESGPSSTKSALIMGLEKYGYQPRDITHVFLTHIHLDHAGAAGWLAAQGAQIHVHKIGAPHLLEPAKLLSSARKVYGDQMDFLWGEFLPVPADKLTILDDGEVKNIANIEIKTIDTPGHANHHLSYVFQDTLFSGDICGVRLGNFDVISLPMPPPEFQLETWKESLVRLNKESTHYIAPTHFGIHETCHDHLTMLHDQLTEHERWMEKIMPKQPSEEMLRTLYQEFVNDQYKASVIGEAGAKAYETANPSFMSAAGMSRYWKKYREGNT